MTLREGLLVRLDTVHDFFRNSAACLDEEDSNFTPHKGTFTVSDHVAHTAQTIDWFMKGGFGIGFDMDFEKHGDEAKAVQSLRKAMEWFDRSIGNAKSIIASKSDDELMGPIPEGPILGGAPRIAVIDGIADHTAHHRGALTVYARALGKTPAMPYGGGD
jgi:uncharacterized damage-inducible protein DinB